MAEQVRLFNVRRGGGGRGDEARGHARDLEAVSDLAYCCERHATLDHTICNWADLQHK
jgi:hypothetical protein